MDTMDGIDKNGLLNGQWTMDRNGHDGRNRQEWTAEWTMDDGQEWTRTAGDIFLCLSIRPLDVKSMLSMLSIRVPVH